MTARVRIEGRDANQAVNTRLGFKIAVSVIPLDCEGNALDARLFARLVLQDLGPIPLAVGPAQIHAQQNLRPVLGLCPPGARVKADNRVAAVIRAAQDLTELDLGHPLSHLHHLRRSLAQGLLALLILR